MVKQAYINGFVNTCRKHGVNPENLLKTAQFIVPYDEMSNSDLLTLGGLGALYTGVGALATHMAGGAAAAPFCAAVPVFGAGLLGVTAGNALGSKMKVNGTTLNKSTQEGWQSIMQKHPWLAGIRKSTLAQPTRKGQIYAERKK